ncbi:uncharacterized protein OCT59_000766 [Rhizophagus irregularis]|uniref:BTB domain-containing protein n=3 Tax=Rhizophagus irregularis TaxID=588596 RepID=A0A916E5B7_9GLOM|nr:hypothetical protein GLOIN_2v201299 [Rhizophagus irregularis DAOM 181602=DAOM 197198]EXX68471.1 hypothetical protein RirG_104840 [Rhizophagus irregularis DAOM 197198w]UZN99497.1 hypothetical protein OCT59_000766 [Rhizophagus irregularis]POG68893.1 hypothetical protein GLOIN_2v201299 [Rhizophagus irregularis DAOM 181602=DAOM 197198]CAB5363511.1 unnamed protein product [Rhizophagus irregularis]CAG8584685.1 5921_t:CDS:1 [Rhizophagus irregularis]|eukprot:XP_025175759.1 hypothetical protein GLOIN_2v201299 [Rhizophagus irregularis DAOM 181602=DAOM 197198]
MKGYSLEQDLRLLFNNPKYSDIEILCKDEKKLYASRIILAARSEVFDGLFYNGMKESYENQIFFPTVDSSTMEIILEYTYTGSIKEECLTIDNIVEAFSAADYFQLLKLQEFIIRTVKNTLEKDYKNNYSPELFSKVVDTMVLTENNVLLNLLVETVSTIPLNTIEFGRLSIKALQYLLSCTHKKKKPFATPEYEVFRYSAILAAKQVSNDAFITLTKQLPTLKQINKSYKVKNGSPDDVNRQEIAKELKPLVKFIDFGQIQIKIIIDIIEPLEITPSVRVYGHQIRSQNSGINYIRGIPSLYKFAYVWDRSRCGSNLIIEDNGEVVQAASDCRNYQSVKAKIAFESKELFEWEITVEVFRDTVWVGLTSRKGFAWAIGSDGSYYNADSKTKEKTKNYCRPFGQGTKVIVHLDMNKRTCAFTVDNIRYPIISKWDNLPSKVYPLVFLNYPSRIRIQPR